jgi:hypothetical protein
VKQIDGSGILPKTVGMLRSRQAFGFWGTQRFKGSHTGNLDFDEMGATRFTNDHTFAGRQIEFRTAPEELSVAANFGIP